MTRALLLLVVLLPVASGLAATILPAFTYLPALGATKPSLAAFQTLRATPGLATSTLLTLQTGLLGTALALASALIIATRRKARLPAFLLAMPHGATAIGLAFLIAPSGWIFRLLGLWDTPPDIATVGDRHGFALVLGLWLKETPYLLLATLAALGQVDAEPKLRAAASLGLPRTQAWFRVILPLIWPQLRLPLAATLAFSLSVVDMALVLAPSTPPPLSVLILHGFTSPDLAQIQPASAAALILLALTLACLLVVLLPAPRLTLPPLPLGWLLGLLGAATIAVTAIWSATATWRFPLPLPDRWAEASWRRYAPRAEALTTLELGIAVTLLALILAVAHLARTGGASPRLRVLLAVPLLVPQISFLFGLQSVLIHLGLAGTVGGVLAAQLIYVLPYVMFSLADPWGALDKHYAQGAATLGASPFTVLRRVTLPLLKRPLAAAAGIGFAVSCSLYLPTLFAGEGRIATLATEAIALASGPDRRITAVVALSQALLPLAGFLVVRRLIR